MNNALPNSIGLFDSGVGGLSIFHALEKVFPQESLLYFADTAHFPYGNKTPEQIVHFSINNSLALIAEGAQLIVVACHTASCYAPQIRQAVFPTPVIGIIEPTIEKALQISKNKRIAVLGTQATIEAKIYQRLFQKICPEAIIFPVACPKLAPAVQQNSLDEGQMRSLIQEYLQQIDDTEIDTLILGSTHYSFLSKMFAEECEHTVSLVDAATFIPSLLKKPMQLSGKKEKPKHKFFISGDKNSFSEFLSLYPPQGNFEVHLFPQHV